MAWSVSPLENAPMGGQWRLSARDAPVRREKLFGAGLGETAGMRRRGAPQKNLSRPTVIH
jgi:hypothetical protein